LICWQQPAWAGSPPIKMKTIQSLGDGTRGLYLSVDNETGVLTVASESNVVNSGTWWEIDDMYFNTYQGYLTHRVRNRGNNAINGRSLVSNADGSLDFGPIDELTDSQRWIVRYAGLYKGYHAFFIQNTKMEFLTLEGNVIKISRPISSGAYWHIHAGPVFPTDQIK
jgi:hypothetical protein